MTIGKIILGLIVMFGGYLLVGKTEWFVKNFGRIPIFDKYFGLSGGTRLGYKIIGILAITIGFLIATGLINDFLLWLTGPLIPAGAPK